jgi:septal ring factor EnvC (AmiA/AmiB activator)
MFDRGIITAEQYHERLIRIGYSETDANRLLALCHSQHRERLERLAKQTAKEAAAEIRRIAGLQQKSQKQLNDMLKQLEEQRKRVEAELERRQKESDAAPVK